MPKGYLVANIRVTDQEKFQSFSGMAGPVIQKFGGKVLARGPDADRHEGNLSGVVMMIEFDSKEALRMNPKLLEALLRLTNYRQVFTISSVAKAVL